MIKLKTDINLDLDLDFQKKYTEKIIEKWHSEMEETIFALMGTENFTKTQIFIIKKKMFYIFVFLLTFNLAFWTLKIINNKKKEKI